MYTVVLACCCIQGVYGAGLAVSMEAAIIILNIGKVEIRLVEEALGELKESIEYFILFDS